MVDAPVTGTFGQPSGSGAQMPARPGVTSSQAPSTADNTLSQSKYDFSYRVFPEDLSNDNYGHYMVININVPINLLGDARSKFQGPTYRSSILPGELSKVDVLRFSGAGNPTGATANEGTVGVWQQGRNTRRIAESIALHMPNPIIFNSQNIYEEVSMTALAGTVGTSAAKVAGGLVGSAIAGGWGAAIGESIGGSLFSGAGEVLGTTSKIAGYPINPRIEVLYSTTPQRQFVFELLMAPKSETESETIKEIVKTLRFHGAPELSSLAGIVPSFVPPAEFDITFYNKGVENTNIPRINTCLLERVEVDYAPTGMYSTFTNGHPVAVRLSLGFREVEILHKLRVTQGF